MKRADAIRKLLCERRDQCSIREAAALLAWRARDLADEIAASELRRVDVDSSVSWRAVAMIAMTQWSYESIERAMGQHASVLPRLSRLTERTVRLPHFQLIAVEAAARRRSLTFNDFLAGHLLDLVCTEAPALVEKVPGFREAYLWPQLLHVQSENAA